jgi:hypothetical protein
MDSTPVNTVVTINMRLLMDKISLRSNEGLRLRQPIPQLVSKEELVVVVPLSLTSRRPDLVFAPSVWIFQHRNVL